MGGILGRRAWDRSNGGLWLPSVYWSPVQMGFCCCNAVEPIACCKYCNSSGGTITLFAYASVYIDDPQGWGMDCGTCTNLDGQTFELPFYECVETTAFGVTYCRATWRDEFDFAVCGETHIYVSVQLRRQSDTPTFNYYTVAIRKTSYTGAVIAADSFGSNSAYYCNGFNIGWRSGVSPSCYSTNVTSVVDFYS
jgi:hypothetical protein